MAYSNMKGVAILLAVLAAVLFTSSCIRVRGPGLMPPVEEGSVGEWAVLSREYSPSRSGPEEGFYRLTVALLYLVREEESSLARKDLRVLFDDEPIPFEFDEGSQVLQTETSAYFGPSLRHSLVVKPSENGKASFPTLTLAFE